MRFASSALKRLGRTLDRGRAFHRFGSLQVSDGALRAEDGRRVTLRGVSLFWSQQTRFFNASVIAWLTRDWCVDIVRVPVGVPDREAALEWRRNWEAVRAVAEACISEGIYVLIDWHSHDPHTAQAAECLGEFADWFCGTPNILYETWNEPSSSYSWRDDIAPHHLLVAERVRHSAPKAVLIAGTPDFCKRVDLAAMEPLPIRNVAYSIHFYAGTHGDGLRLRVRAALNAGLPLFASEWGTGEADGDGLFDPTESSRWLKFLDSKDVSTINWSITDKRETCASLHPEAAAHGGWTRRDWTESGHFVRRYLRSGRACR